MRLHVLIRGWLRRRIALPLPLVVALAACSLVVDPRGLEPCSDLSTVGEPCGACGQAKIVCDTGTPACADPRKVGDACGVCGQSKLACDAASLSCDDWGKGGVSRTDQSTPAGAPAPNDPTAALLIARNASLAIAWAPSSLGDPSVTEVQLFARRQGYTCADGSDPICECCTGCDPPCAKKSNAGSDTVVVVAYRGTPEQPGAEIGRAELPIATLQCDAGCTDTRSWTHFPIAPSDGLRPNDPVFVTFETTSPSFIENIAPVYAAGASVRALQKNPLKGEAWHPVGDAGGDWTVTAQMTMVSCPSP